MKKFASEKVFRNIIFALLLTQAQFEIPAQNAAQPFQNPLKKCWEIEDDSIERFASDDANLILSDRNGEIKSINRKTLDENWKISIGSKNETYIRLNDSEIFLITKENQTASGTESSKTESANVSAPKSESESDIVLRKVDEQTGIIDEIIDLGKIEGDFSLTNIQNLFSKIDLNDAGEMKNVLKRLDAFSNMKNSKDFNAEKFFTFYDDERLIIAYERRIRIMKLKDGGQITDIDLSSGKADVTAVNIAGNFVFWGDEAGKVYEKNAFGKNLEKLLRTGAKISHIEKNAEELLISSNDNFIYFYSTTKNRVMWKKRLAGRISIDPKFGKNLIVVTNGALPEIVFADQESGKTFNQISLPEGTFIKDFQIVQAEDSVLILTNSGLQSFKSSC